MKPENVKKVIARNGDVRVVEWDYAHSDDWRHTATIDPSKWIEAAARDYDNGNHDELHEKIEELIFGFKYE